MQLEFRCTKKRRKQGEEEQENEIVRSRASTLLGDNFFEFPFLHLFVSIIQMEFDGSKS